MERPVKIRLHIISPVHIGCDDFYEPTSFVIDEKKRKLIAFNPLDFVDSLSEQEMDKFTAICMEGTVGSIIKIYKFLSTRKFSGREVDISADFIKHFNKVKKMRADDEEKIGKELNKFSVGKTAYEVNTEMPYIPGTSLKGALRTAYLNKVSRDNRVAGFRGKAKDLEYELLGGKFDTDPFRMVKISDLMPVGDARTRIVYAVNKKKKPSKFQARGPFQILETVEEGAVFEGFINIQQPAVKALIQTAVTINEILQSVNEFFIPAVNKESGVIREIGGSHSVVERINQGFKDMLGKTAFLARIGRHSGAEEMTIEGYRQIMIMQGKGQRPKYLDHATTIWLASETSKPGSNKNLTPFGWVVLEVVENDFTWPVQQCKTVRKAGDGLKNGAEDEVDEAKEMADDTPNVIKLFNSFHSAPSPDNFIDFIKSITKDDLSDLNKISFKGMESAINIGVVSRLENLEVEPEILKAIASKVSEIIEPTKKWSDDKKATYRRLKEMAGG